MEVQTNPKTSQGARLPVLLARIAGKFESSIKIEGFYDRFVYFASSGAGRCHGGADDLDIYSPIAQTAPTLDPAIEMG